jgi:hypothetical protein
MRNDGDADLYRDPYEWIDKGEIPRVSCLGVIFQGVFIAAMFVLVLWAAR